MKAKNENKKGLWTEEEDKILLEYIREHGRGKWNHISKMTGLKRCGKSCRLRWLNYLSPNVKHGDFSEEEEDLIIRLHNLLGNRWSLIAGRVPGRTDNQVKNHWNSHLCKKLGIKRQNRKAVCSTERHSSQIHETERRVDNENLEVHPNSDITINVGNTSNGEAQDEHYVESLLFSNDLFNLSSPGLVDFLDSYPLDQILQYY